MCRERVFERRGGDVFTGKGCRPDLLSLLELAQHNRIVLRHERRVRAIHKQLDILLPPIVLSGLPWDQQSPRSAVRDTPRWMPDTCRRRCRGVCSTHRSFLLGAQVDHQVQIVPHVVILARYGRDVGEMWARCRRDMGEIWARYGRDTPSSLYAISSAWKTAWRETIT